MSSARDLFLRTNSRLTAEDIADIDVQLRGFEGRASRDDWVSEAKALMAESRQS